MENEREMETEAKRLTLLSPFSHQSADDGAVERAVVEASAPTADRVARLEKEVARLTAALEVVGRSGGGGTGGSGGAASAAALVAAALAGEDVAAAAAAAAGGDASNPSSSSTPARPLAPGLETFLAAFQAAAADVGSVEAADAAWKAGFPPLGTAPAIPRLLRASGPARIRNKALSKRETERTVKEVWKEREAAAAAGAAAAREPLIDFLYAHLQKKVGIPAAVVEVREEEERERARKRGAGSHAISTPVTTRALALLIFLIFSF